jgi:hypothetical protein
VTLPGGNATWTALAAGSDGQLLEVKNLDATGTLTLPASVFHGVTDLTLDPNNGVLLYYDSTVPGWEVTAP